MSEDISGLRFIKVSVGLALVLIGFGVLYVTQQVEGLHKVGYAAFTLVGLTLTATGLITIFSKFS
ncbi:MAG: hypothetical protein QXL67_01590 [Candidatus Bathyarchaeia archaeon]